VRKKALLCIVFLKQKQLQLTFYGNLFTDMAINGTTWHKRQSIRFSCCGEACWGGYNPGYYASKNCNQHIYWPTLWGTVQGTAYDESENPIETGAEIRLNAWIDSDYQGGYVNAVIPSANGVYGPVSIPSGVMSPYPTI